LYVQIVEFVKDFSLLNESDTDEDEAAAGIHKIQAFGIFATLDTLANGEILKHNEIWKLPAKQVYTKLLYDKVVRNYQRDLKKIYDVKQRAST